MDPQNTSSSNGVQFEENNIRGWGAVRYYRQTEPPKFAQFLIDHSGGLFTDAEGAAKGLIWIAIIFFGISIFFTGNSFGLWGDKNQKFQVYQEDIPLEIKKTLTPEELQKYPHRQLQQ